MRPEIAIRLIRSFRYAWSHHPGRAAGALRPVQISVQISGALLGGLKLLSNHSVVLSISIRTTGSRVQLVAGVHIPKRAVHIEAHDRIRRSGLIGGPISVVYDAHVEIFWVLQVWKDGYGFQLSTGGKHDVDRFQRRLFYRFFHV